MTVAAITISLDPMIHIGPLAISWHGLMIAVGILAGAWLGSRYARERGLDTEEILPLVVVLAVGGIVGAKILYLAQHGGLADPAEWIGSRGYSFYGALLLGPLAVAVWMRTYALSARYLDALAAGFPLGMAVGRIGDLISGEHYGPATDTAWAFVYTDSDAEVPMTGVAYHSGAFYEILVSLVLLAVLWPLRHRLRKPLMLLWATVGGYAAGRFLIFFWRSDVNDGLLGLNSAQLESLGLIVLCAIAALVSWRISDGKAEEREEPGARAVSGSP